MSEKSSLLNDEEYIQKRKNERFAYILGIFTQLIWSINGLQLKSIQPHFQESYSLNSIIFWRCLPVIIISYYECYYKKIRITPHNEIKHIVWFYFRSLGNYFCVLLNITVLSYFRLSTSRVFLSCQPLITIFLSIIFLSENFYFRYLIGILIGLIGSTIIALNDKKPQSRTTIIHDNMSLGLVYAVLFLTTMSFASIGQKMITRDKMPVWFENGVKAAMLAPTAMNQQKFFITLEGDTPVIKAGMGPFSKVDLGIVKYNFEAASGHACRQGPRSII